MPSSKRNLLAASGQGGGEPYEGDIAVAHFTSPYISVYPWSSGFGTKYANPSTLPTGSGEA
jgi:hypothetical protein